MLSLLKIKQQLHSVYSYNSSNFIVLVVAFAFILGSCQQQNSEKVNSSSCIDENISFNVNEASDVQTYLTEKFNILLGSNLCQINKKNFLEAISSQTTKNLELVFNVRGELQPTSLEKFRNNSPNVFLSVDELYIKRENNVISKISIYVSEIKNPTPVNNKITAVKSQIKNELSNIKGFAGEIDGEFLKIEIKGYNDQYNIILFKYTAVAEGLEHFNKSGKIYPNSMEIYFESFKKSKLKLIKKDSRYFIESENVSLESY